MRNAFKMKSQLENASNNWKSKFFNFNLFDRHSLLNYFIFFFRRFIESSKGDLRETVDSIHGEPIDGDLNRVIDGTKRENKALGEKMVKIIYFE